MIDSFKVQSHKNRARSGRRSHGHAECAQRKQHMWHARTTLLFCGPALLPSRRMVGYTYPHQSPCEVSVRKNVDSARNMGLKATYFL